MGARARRGREAGIKIESVHVPIYCDSEAAKCGALLTLKTIRVGFPNTCIVIHLMGGREMLVGDWNERTNYQVNIELPTTNDRIIKRLVESESEGFAVVDSDMVFFENCEDFEPSGLIAGEFIPEFVCPIARAVTFSRLHTAFFVVSDPVKLRRAIDLSYRPAIPKFCPFDPFAPVVTFQGGVPHFHDSCSVLYHALHGYSENFGADMLRRFVHMYGGSYVKNGEHADRIKAAYENPETARGMRGIMTRYFEERKP
jgi:hypothetical protein